jgi:hypothetical protein
MDVGAELGGRVFPAGGMAAVSAGSTVGSRVGFVTGTGMTGLTTGAESVPWGASIVAGVSITPGEAGFGMFAEDAPIVSSVEAQRACASTSK